MSIENRPGFLVWGLCVLLLTHCTASTPVEPDVREQVLEIRMLDGLPLERASGEAPPDITSRVENGHLVVIGDLVTPCQTQPIEGAWQIDGNAVTLTVSIFDPPVCATVAGWFSYTARLEELAPGEYELRVIQPEPMDWQLRVVHQATFRIP